MKISIITLFPEMFGPVFGVSIIKRAQEKGFIEISLVNLRDFGLGSRKTVDDRPYGGGAGMILRVEPIYAALQKIKNQKSTLRLRSGLMVNEVEPSKIKNKRSKIKDQKISAKVILLDPKGERFNQKKAREFSRLDNLVLICGHYEGVDARVEGMVDEIISLGDFVLTGGEIPAMAVVDAAIRLIPGVLKKEEATAGESFSNQNDRPLLEYPQYTRPEEFMGKKVPAVLLSGNHEEVEKWRTEKALSRTEKDRPDLLENSEFKPI